MVQEVLEKKIRWSEQLRDTLGLVAKSIRQLSIDAVEKAESGHPGLPMGCAELGAYLYGYRLRHNPKDPTFANRDRFILSAGHGSMLLYSCLYLSGFGVSLEDLKNFRQLHSRTPGHPESLDTLGVETTTGPLGQGLGNGVGQALGLKILQQKFPNLFDAKVYCLVGDGCIMEGVSSEVSSFAGHLGLDNLVVIYDANRVCLDGPLDECCSEDVSARYRGYGFEVYEVDGHDLDEIHRVFEKADNQTKPVLIVARTVIGKGSSLEGTHKIHGSPMGPEETKHTKERLGLSSTPFYVPEDVYRFFAQKLEADVAFQQAWNRVKTSYFEQHKELAQEFLTMQTQELPEGTADRIAQVSMGPSVATRSASYQVLEVLGPQLPYLYGGSADLSGSDKTMMKGLGCIRRHDFSGRNIKYGVREFGMATIATGLSQTGMIRPFIGTFLTFSDYMRNAIRLASLQQARVIYQFTHDSIFLGEDGPTHQPVEHIACLRAIPGLYVVRPADGQEVKMAWQLALELKRPVALILSRQNLPQLEGTQVPYEQGVGRGGYVVLEDPEAELTLLATGSEVSLALASVQELSKRGKKARVVSMPCIERFEEQSQEYRERVLGSVKRVSLEAGIRLGWERYASIHVSVESFGLSAPAKDLAKEFGFTPERVVEKIFA